MSRLAGLAEWLDDAVNPLAVRELRQAVRGRVAIGLLLLFLSIEVVVLGLSLVQVRPDSRLDLGAQMFTTLLGVLLGTCMLALPLATAVRIWTERSETNLDLLYVTSLRPAQIVRGKLLSSVVLAALIYSASMPFLSLTYLLRGVDVPTILMLLVWGFGGVVASLMLAIFCACIPGARFTRLLVGASGVWGLAVLYGVVMAVVADTVRQGLGSELESRDFWLAAGLGVVIWLIALGGLFVLAVAWISPPSANRALPPRLYLSAVWLVSGAACMIWAAVERDADPVYVWYFLSGSVLCAALPVVVCEREQWGPRVTRAIPRRAALRPFAFALYSGAAGGVAWCCTLLGLTLVAAIVGCELGGKALLDDREAVAGVAFALYTLAYALGALHARRRLLRERITRESTWLLTLALAALGCAMPPLIAALTLGPELLGSSLAYVGNPFVGFSGGNAAWEQLALSGLAAGLVGALSVGWFFGRYRRFVRR